VPVQNRRTGALPVCTFQAERKGVAADGSAVTV
jgi:hypothetical protein